eukprot:3231081-Rhodomonas_salina.1
MARSARPHPDATAPARRCSRRTGRTRPPPSPSHAGTSRTGARREKRQSRRGSRAPRSGAATTAARQATQAARFPPAPATLPHSTARTTQQGLPAVHHDRRLAAGS